MPTQSHRRASRASFQGVVTAVLLVGLLAGSLAVFAMDSREPALHASLLLDSTPTNNPAGMCDDARGIAKELADYEEGPVDVTVFQTSTGRQDRQAIRIGSAQLKHAKSVYHRVGQDAQRKQRVDDFVDSVEDLCRQVVATTESPIAAGIKGAVDLLQNQQCGGPVRCVTYVRSDLIEEYHPRVMGRLYPKNAGVQRRAAAATDAPPLVDNSNSIEVIACGLAERTVRPGKPLPSPRAAEDAFRPEFSEPELVSFDDYCPR
jgi:hypothetical protein